MIVTPEARWKSGAVPSDRLDDRYSTMAVTGQYGVAAGLM